MNKLLLILCVFSAQLAFAQGDSTKVNLFKISPLHLFDLDNGLSVAYEHLFKKNSSLQFETGYGNSYANLWLGFESASGALDDYGGFNNFRNRLEYRKFFKTNDPLKPRYMGNYYAFELFNKYVFRKREFTVGREVIGFNPQYYEKVDSKSTKLVTGFHFKIGRQFQVSSLPKNPEKPWVFDFFCGVGFRFIHTDFSYENAKPSDQNVRYYQYSIGTINRGGSALAPIISGTLGLKIGRRF